MVPWCGAVTGHRVRRGSVRAQHGEWRQAQSTAGHRHGSSEHGEHYGHVTRDTRHGTRDHAGERDAARDTAGHAGHRHHRYVTVTVRTVCTCKCCDMRTFCKLHRITEAPVQCNLLSSIPSWTNVRPGPAAGALLHLAQRQPVLDPAPHGRPGHHRRVSRVRDSNGISRQNCQPALDPVLKYLYVCYNVPDNK